jgi:mRNA deadenylase 3'-5' endonuclease subunit Ccr4
MNRSMGKFLCWLLIYQLFRWNSEDKPSTLSTDSYWSFKNEETSVTEPTTKNESVDESVQESTAKKESTAKHTQKPTFRKEPGLSFSISILIQRF